MSLLHRLSSAGVATRSARTYVAGNVAVVLLCCHGAARGQAPDSARLPGRWYVGAGAAVHKYFARRPPFSTISPAYVAAGYWLTPRVALHAAIQYGRRTEQGFGWRSESDGETVSRQQQGRISSTALTVLLRRRLGRGQRRLQLDGLLGLALVHGRSGETLTVTTPAGTQRYALPDQQSTEPHLVAGLGARYRLGSRWAVGAEVVANQNLLMSSFTLTGSGANAGISYLFGPAKP